MNAAKAINSLQSSIDGHEIRTEIFNLAIEALKKQIPQKIKKADIDFVIYGCPSCDYSDSLWSCGKHDKHCPNCGQMLDWGEEC